MLNLSNSGFPYEGFDFLFNDFETASKLDVTEVGTSRYVMDPSTRPLMNSWVINKTPQVQIWEPDIQVIPPLLHDSLLNPRVIKVAFNVAFERGIWKHKLGIDIPIEQWFDVKVLARYLSFPGPLKKVCQYMELPPEYQKMTEEGEKYIRMFSTPAREGGRVTLWGIEEDFYNSRENRPAEWDDFKKYCIQDTVTERYMFYSGIKTFLNTHEIQAWHLDQTINECGLPVNTQFVKNALEMAKRSIEELRKMLIELTGLENPNSDSQMLGWLTERGYPFTSLGKYSVKFALDNPGNLTPLAQEVLLIRKEFKRTSYTKLETLLMRVNEDGRIRDCFAFMGGARTGRWSGQDVQFQNLAKPDKRVEENLERALKIIETKDFDAACKEFGVTIKWCGKERHIPSAIGMVISCIRSIFQAKPGHILVVCDLSAIENRVLGWLAGCEEILNVFRNKLDAYKAFATMMYMVEYDKVTKEMRTVAKPAVLGCGYGLGPGVRKNEDGTYTIQWMCSECKKKFWDKEHVCHDDKGNRKGDLNKAGLMGYAEKMGVLLTPEQAYKAWETFHKYKEIPQLWNDLEKAAIKVIRKGGRVKVRFVEFSRMKRKNGQYVLRIQLPSGRFLHYINARVETTLETSKRTGRRYEKHKIVYDGIGHGVGATTKQVKWGPVYTYGGKLAENIVQAISRDILSIGMKRANAMGATIVGHVHDEILCEEKLGFTRFGIEDLQWCMSEPIDWAPDLPLGAEGYEAQIYRKG